MNNYPARDVKPATLRHILTILLCVLLTLSLCACRCGQQVDQALEILGAGILRFGDANENWQLIMQDTRDKLLDKGLKELANQVDAVLDHATGDALVISFCAPDFFRTRMQQELQQILAQYKHEPVTPPVPFICKVVPTTIDYSEPPLEITYYGYDLDNHIEAVLFQKNGTAIKIGTYRSAPYQPTITLGTNGPSLSQDSDRIVLHWNNPATNERVELMPEVGITAPLLPICEIVTNPTYTHFRPNDVTYNPPIVKGDTEFDDNGPRIRAQVQLVNLGDRVIAWVHMNAIECQTWSSMADGSWAKTIYTPPPGYQVQKVGGDNRAVYDYTDTTHELDNPEGTGGSFQAKVTFIGSTAQQDACGLENCGWWFHTGIKIEFNVIDFTLIQTDNCKPRVNNPPSEIDKKAAQLKGFGQALGPEVYTADGTGRWRHYEGGWIYWTPATGAHAIYGSIYAEWASLGYEASVLGYPTTDETPTADGRGRYNRFQYGVIYWTPQTRAHEVHGSILAKWQEMGSEQSSLGYPISDEGWGGTWVGGSGGNWSRLSIFENGVITYLWSEGTSVVAFASDQIALFVDTYYRGQYVVKGVGSYPNPDAIGLPNDSISSILVGSKVQATLCQDYDYGGICETFTGYDPELVDNRVYTDRVSAVRVERR
jgi:hypothetical protein